METSESIFHLLARAGDTSVLQIRESDVEVDAGPVAHAIDHSGMRILLVPLTKEQTVREDTASRGVILAKRELIDQDVSRRFAMFRCELPALDEQFGILCDEVLSALAASPHDPGGICAGVLERWRELLGPRNERLLGEFQLMGLLAELRFLERLAQETPDALTLWTGPAGSRFDFMAGSRAVEVKATTSRERFTVGIHGLLQLEPPAGGELYLWAQRYERVPDGSESVPDSVRRLEGLGLSSHDLLEKLARVGYMTADTEAYRAVRFQALDDRSFAVINTFPRLVRASLADSSLADRLLAVSYSIDLSDTINIPGSMTDLDAVATAFLGGGP